MKKANLGSTGAWAGAARLIAGLATVWLMSGSTSPAYGHLATSAHSDTANPAEVWQIIMTAIQTVGAHEDAARRADRVAASLNIVDAEISFQPEADVIHINGHSQTVGAVAAVNFSGVSSPSKNAGVSFEVQIPTDGNTTRPCIEYKGIESNLRALGAVGDLQRDYGVDGLNMRSGTVALLSKTLLGFVHFYMPLKDAGPICLQRISVANYDGGVPAWANTLRR